METKPRFKNSFGVKGTKGELLHFAEISYTEGWQRAISLAEEKEEVPEYVECIQYSKNCLTKGKIYKVFNSDASFTFIDDDRNTRNGWISRNFKPSTKEAFIRQELLEEARKRGYKEGVYIKTKEGVVASLIGDLRWSKDTITTDYVYIYKNGWWAEIITEEPRYTLSEISEALKETLNKIKK